MTFVFLASQARAGSTALAGMLTIDGISQIFCEPAIQRGNDKARQWLGNRGILPRVGNKLEDGEQCCRAFVEKCMPRLKALKLIGVKEINMQGWVHWEPFFKDVRYVCLVRDPRDMVLSHLELAKKADVRTPMTKAGFITRILCTWRSQREMEETGKALTVRYEDLCTRGRLRDVFTHVGLAGRQPSKPNRLYKMIPARQYECKRHGDSVSGASVGRWMRQKSGPELRLAKDVHAAVHDYCAAFGYL